MKSTAEHAIDFLLAPEGDPRDAYHHECPGCHDQVHHTETMEHAQTCVLLHEFVRDTLKRRDDRRDNDRHFGRIL